MGVHIGAETHANCSALGFKCFAIWNTNFF